LDTKLKNSRNVRIGIIIIGLLLAVGVNVSLFPWMIRNAEQKSAQLFSSSENVNTEYIDTLYQGAYVLYTEIKKTVRSLLSEREAVMMITIIFQSGAVPLRASGLRRIIMRRMERKKK
jgi:hypothetical protein